MYLAFFSLPFAGLRIQCSVCAVVSEPSLRLRTPRITCAPPLPETCPVSPQNPPSAHGTTPPQESPGTPSGSRVTGCCRDTPPNRRKPVSTPISPATSGNITSLDKCTRHLSLIDTLGKNRQDVVEDGLLTPSPRSPGPCPSYIRPV